MTVTKFDIIIIGGGPGGYVAAIRAAQLGFKTALVEREHLGGICLNWGCIPTKALLRSAEIYKILQQSKDFGFNINNISIDLKKIVERSRVIAAHLSSGVSHLLKKNKITVFNATGTLIGESRIKLSDGKILHAAHIIVATGARARVLSGLEPDGKFLWSYKEALLPTTIPKKLLVVGAGAIGIEFADFYNSLGSDVTVVEILPNIMPTEDEEVSAFAKKLLQKKGIKIITSATIKGLDKAANAVTVTIEKDRKAQKFTVNKIISAVGISPNVENIALEEIGVKLTQQGFIKINEWCQTSVSKIYAVGDVAGPPCLAHKASHEGILCVEKIAGRKDLYPINFDRIPSCTYCQPQIASVGLTEAKAKERGYTLKIGRFPFVGNGKAIALGENEGMVKTIFDDKTGELLGAHMIGTEVTEMIQGYGIAQALEATEVDLMHTIFAHPTLSEMMHESVLSAYGRAIHI